MSTNQRNLVTETLGLVFVCAPLMSLLLGTSLQSPASTHLVAAEVKIESSRFWNLFTSKRKGKTS